MRPLFINLPSQCRNCLFQTLTMRVLQNAARKKFWSFQEKAAFSSLASDVTLDSLEMKSAPLTTLSEEEEMMRDTGKNTKICFNG